MPLAVVAGNNEYRLVKLVATTPLGSVYHARHVSSDRVVAVRLLRSIGADRAAMATFREQLPAIAVMRHRNLLPVEGWGAADGVPYVVTPLPDAGLLADLLAGGWRPDRDTAIRFLRGIADAVDYAHGLGVVHGGLGPASVLVAADGSALVAHFGLAHLAGASQAAIGAAGPADDVHAFAVVARELLAGPPSHGGGAGTPLAAPGASLPAPAGDVLRRALDGDPATRWATCGAMLDAVEAGLTAPAPAASPAGARGLSAPARAWVAAAASLVLLAGVGAVILAAGRMGPGHPAAAPVSAGVPSGAGDGPVSASPAAVDPVSSASPAPSIVPVAAPSALPSATARPAAPARPAPAPTRSVAPGPTPAPGLSIVVSDPTPLPGESNVQVTGHGFDPNQQYVVVFTQGRGWRLLAGPASPRGNGDFVSPVQIPPTAQPGSAAMVGCIYRVNQGPSPRCAGAPLTVRR